MSAVMLRWTLLQALRFIGCPSTAAMSSEVTLRSRVSLDMLSGLQWARRLLATNRGMATHGLSAHLAQEALLRLTAYSLRDAT